MKAVERCSASGGPLEGRRPGSFGERGVAPCRLQCKRSTVPSPAHSTPASPPPPVTLPSQDTKLFCSTSMEEFREIVVCSKLPGTVYGPILYPVSSSQHISSSHALAYNHRKTPCKTDLPTPRMQHQRLLPSRKKNIPNPTSQGISPPVPSSIPHPSSLSNVPSITPFPQKCGLASNPSGALSPSAFSPFLPTFPSISRVCIYILNSPRQIRPIPLGPPRLQQRRHKRQREARHQVRRHERGFEAVAGVAREAGGVVAEVGEHVVELW